ncbi:feline leukemia virus subgroup C receptor-related protein 2-like isoform X2 [Varroa destructor]|uniref:Choline/ethanolamine transporter FLVCR1 n=1 Tax=Varroa destructor TaxID=109461 RepID=A0A7M7MBB9_VARDE|nr:feline leukemia virus subgroup C receptor-related protein 2-like isoform X2 [Varroa destructor]
MALESSKSDGTPLQIPAIATSPASLTVPTEEDIDKDVQVSPYRFVILLLFSLYSLSNGFQWIELSIIRDVVKSHYSVSDQSVNWTALIYCASYIPLILPASWIMEKKGLRCSVVLGAAGTMLGSWIKVFATPRDLFWLLMIGQTIVACSQIFILSVPPRLATVWFGSQEVSRACAAGVFGNQLGIALGFQVPTLLVPMSEDHNLVAKNLQILFGVVAGVTSVVFIAILLAFREKPSRPPNKGQLMELPSDYRNTMRQLATNSSYLLLLISYGINTGTFYAVSTLLSQVSSKYYPDEGSRIGFLGFMLVVAGMLGSVVCGIMLDKTKKFKEITLIVYTMSMICMFAYTFVLPLGHVWPLFYIALALGFFMTGYLPLGFEFASELTYPEHENTSAGLLNAAAQLFGVLFTSAATELLGRFGDCPANLALSGAMVIGTIMTAFCKSDLRRQRAFAGESQTLPSVSLART